MCWRITKELPRAVGNLHTDAVTLLATALRSGVIAGSCATQTRPGAASIIVTACGPARPGAKASIHSHIANLLEPKIKHLRVMAFLRKRSLH